MTPRPDPTRPTDAQVADAGQHLDRYPDPDRATTVALGAMVGAAEDLAAYLAVRPSLAAAHPDLVTGVQQMLAVGRAWDDRYGLAAATRQRDTMTALGDQVEAWLAQRAEPPVIPGDDRPGWW